VLLRFGFLATIWGLIAASLVLIALAWDLPRPESALATTRRPSTTLLASDGKLLATNGDLYGETLRLRHMPAHLPAAFIAIEDRRWCARCMPISPRAAWCRGGQRSRNNWRRTCS
jgi:penicillin-binding protein 1A